MGACSYMDCTNRSENGYQMCKFPRNPNRRKIWLANCKNKIRNPESSNIVLCQVHFEEKMWCQFGSKNHRLRPDAVPTLFGKLSSVNSNTLNHTNENLMQPEETAKRTNDVHMQSEETAKHYDEVPMQPEETAKHYDEVPMQPNETSVGNSQKQLNTTAESDIFDLQGAISLQMSQEDIRQLIKKFKENEKKLKETEQEMQLRELQFKQKEEEMKEKINVADKLLAKEMNSRINLKRKYDACYKRLKTIEKKVSEVSEFESSMRAKLLRLMTKDQIDAVILGYKRYPKWNNETLMLGYRLRFACGSSGYEQLLKENWPLPSIRCLTRRVETFKFRSGELNQEVLNFLTIKIGVLKAVHRHCMLVLDEMSITPIVTYDTSTHEMIGYVTLRDKKLSLRDKATHALVLMLAGLCARWKQTVRYEFSGDSVDEQALKKIIEEVIIEAEKKCNLLVHVVTSDMGPVNVAVWRIYGITSHRYGKTVNSITHPVDSKRKLYFYADTPHALKNMNSGLQANEKATLPQKFVEKYNLPSNKFKIQHFFDIVEVDKENDYKISPKLKLEHLQMHNDHYGKMRVGNSKAVLSESNASALQYLAHENAQDERLSTAQLVLEVAKWFDCMCSTNKNLALSYKNMDIYNQKVEFLKEFMHMISELRVGEKGFWKPWQTGILISTTTVIELSQYLLSQDVTYFLPSRLTQNCLENLFSVIRSLSVIPNALQFKQNLKLITISQFMKTTKNSNYEVDDRSFLAGFLDILIKDRSFESNFLLRNAEDFIVVTPEEVVALNNHELNAFYYCAGYLISNIKKNEKVCDECINATKCDKPAVLLPYHYFTNTKAQNLPASVTWITEETFRFFLQMDTIFRMYYVNIRNAKLPLEQFFLQKFLDVEYSLPLCHRLKEKIAKRFYLFRLRLKSKIFDINVLNKLEKSNDYGSKSAAMHSRIK